MLTELAMRAEQASWVPSRSCSVVATQHIPYQ